MPPREKRSAAKTDPAVVAFIEKLDHPFKPELETLRELILGLAPEVCEEVKWNAPSFRTTEFFATFHLRPTDRLVLVLHQGAKVKAGKTRPAIADPAGLLEWRGNDRALVTFHSREEVVSRRDALEAALREWVAYL